MRICVAAAERLSGLRDTVPVGSTLTMKAGSSAQILMAWEEPERLHRGLQGARFTATALSGVRRRGWAQSIGEREPGVASVSARVRGPSNRVVAAVSVSGPIERLTRHPGRMHARRSSTPPPASPRPSAAPAEPHLQYDTGPARQQGDAGLNAAAGSPNASSLLRPGTRGTARSTTHNPHSPISHRPRDARNCALSQPHNPQRPTDGRPQGRGAQPPAADPHHPVNPPLPGLSSRLGRPMSEPVRRPPPPLLHGRRPIRARSPKGGMSA